ncbi:MAG: DUF1624 domain-containing protein [Melioribacteraceae bacterium]|nr:DUF1624 domain-containing protein [Melioribacteraceae bacterium]
MNNSKQERIVFLDILRLLAVFLMIEGHSFDVFLSEKFRQSGTMFFDLWNLVRGITAPIFFFTTGTVFNYLLIKSENEKSNPRVKKGIKRGLLLVLIGYLLRYPTHTIVYFGDVTAKQWQIFFTVDALHVIGIGLLLIVLIYLAEKKIKFDLSFSYLVRAIIIFAISPFINAFNWSSILPDYLAGYFYYGTGSIFPLFPWLGYIFAGAYFGSWLRKNSQTGLDSNGVLKLSIVTIFLFVIGFLFNHLENNYLNGFSYWHPNSAMVFYRLGIVIIIVLGISLIFKNDYKLPQFLSKVSKNSLYIYIVHLIILYGCAWFPGINKYIGKSFTIFESFILTIIIYLSVILLLFAKEKVTLRFIQNPKITS